MSKANELLYDSPNFAEQFLTASVWAGDLLLLYSDGVTEMVNNKKE